MCGIVGYIGFREASDVIIKGLKRLEYRGYDSAGIAILNGTLVVRKGKGKVANLESLISQTNVKGTIGIGHTRWATHGEPNDINAHPHWDGSQNFAIVHNGIIENYDALKQELQNKGHEFQGETDTEVLAHLIQEIKEVTDVDFETAVQMALKQVDGTYGLAIVNKNERDKIIVARKGSPLLLGIGDDEVFIASDASPIIEYTNKVVYLDDDEMAIISRDGYQVKTISNVALSKEVHELEMSIEQIEKGGFPHFMLKEIHEQSETIADCMRGRLVVEDNKIVLGGISAVTDRLVNARRLIIAACGTSWHAGLVGEYLIESLAKMSVEVEYASEFRYRDPLITEEDVMLVISQSGETADTLAAVREARSKGALVLGICNVVGSTIARETDAGIYTHAGPEIGVASTKAFTAQVTVLAMMAILLGQRRAKLDEKESASIIKAMSEIPAKVAEIMTKFDEVDAIARLFAYAPNFLYLGRSYNFPVALEGALKLKEISYIHAEGYPAAEMKHGPIALIDELMPVVVLAAADHTNDKMISNIEEVRARKGRVIAITTDNNQDVQRLSEFSITVPETHDLLTPLLTVIPLQILSYQIAVYRKCNVDQPRNLAKSVTVE
ncbi:glutamine--fructose-6-phosphate transaminase [Cyclonatronum proteinivorum]|uniref:Glutamine--fructose-6-phosphate aminotransferase [isomerizing] n=1 Tax=Cyclonatronum proteinivorum TaxID=1457365 RepID=A0A345UGD3_9BACT|nr:glutamine--fructose-6-phosphate transaminase (isomerizing) [Cyclonatronum proteinivorum]AXI99534.1 glutamine--fructose-6-phosphate transaminase [Cyclonatronum proteinivorum]